MEKIENEITLEEADLMKISELSREIESLAKEASDISLKLEEENLADVAISVSQKESLKTRLFEVVKEGDKLSEERAQILANFEKK